MKLHFLPRCLHLALDINLFLLSAVSKLTCPNSDLPQLNNASSMLSLPRRISLNKFRKWSYATYLQW